VKKAFEENDTAPGTSPSSPVKGTPAKAKTPRPKAAKASSGDDTEDIQATPTPKRKRATPKKKLVDEDEQKSKPEPDVEDKDELLDTKPKRAKVTPKPKAKANGAIKKEVMDDDQDAFFDASEQPEVDIRDLADAAGEQVKNERKSTIVTPGSSHTSSAFTSKFLQHRAEHC
jgi:hypothetical protein